MRLWSGKFEGVTPKGWQETQYCNNSFLGINKPDKDSYPEVNRPLLLRNLAEVVERCMKGDFRPLIFETERIDLLEFNTQRWLVQNWCEPILSEYGMTWGVFDQMGGTHSLNAFADPNHRNRKEVYERAASVLPIGNTCFTPFYLQQQVMEKLTLNQWCIALRSKIDCCRQAGYEAVCLTICPYFAELREVVAKLRETTSNRNQMLSVSDMSTYRVPDEYLAAAIDECCHYGDGINLWTFYSEPDDKVLAIIEG